MKKYLSILKADPNFTAGLRFPINAGLFSAGLVASPFVGLYICSKTGWDKLQEKSEKQEPVVETKNKVNTTQAKKKTTTGKKTTSVKPATNINSEDLMDDLAAQPAG